DPRVRTFLPEALQAVEQQPRREQDLDRKAEFRFPSRGELARGMLERTGLLEQRPAPPVEKLSGRGQGRLATLDLECLYAKRRFDLLDGIRHRGLRLAERLGCLRVTSCIDDRNQGSPLV